LATLSHALTVQRRCLMDDEGVLRRIDELAREEHELFEHQSHGRVTPADHERLRRLQIMLDQCWDLLRQRRARREFGENPEEAQLRPVTEVEDYQQ
jgi:hypothetical protein